jgi:hypothetical protein
LALLQFAEAAVAQGAAQPDDGRVADAQLLGDVSGGHEVQRLTVVEKIVGDALFCAGEIGALNALLQAGVHGAKLLLSQSLRQLLLLQQHYTVYFVENATAAM